jgi:hypothetical protein
VCDWAGSVATSETTLHQLSPYIGKIKSSIAASLISQFANEGDLVYDGFSGSGTVALEAWAAKRRVVANDLSPYAYLLTRAKLFPCRSLEDALSQIEQVSVEANKLRDAVDLRGVPRWVRQFFHPETLRPLTRVARLARGAARIGKQPVSPGCAGYGYSANPQTCEREHHGDVLHQDCRC